MKIGEQVQFKTRYFAPSYHREDRYVESLVTGVVIKSPSWLAPDMIAIAPGANGQPFRVISTKHIVESGEVVVTKTAEEVQTWTIQGSRGNEYTVMRTGNGYSCTCPGFTFRKSCKHLSQVEA